MRIQLELSDNSVAQIKGLMKETHIKTYSELFSYSLAILIWAVKESRKNLIIVSADESTGKAVSELALQVQQEPGNQPVASVVRRAHCL